jgi:uncharacterized Zn-finger protein
MSMAPSVGVYGNHSLVTPTTSATNTIALESLDNNWRGVITSMASAVAPPTGGFKQAPSSVPDGTSMVERLDWRGAARETVCPVCGMRMWNSYSLARHMRIHTGDKPYQCPFCDFKCTQNSSLKRHITKKHEPQV